MRADLWRFIAPTARKALIARAREFEVGPHPTIPGMFQVKLFAYFKAKRGMRLSKIVKIVAERAHKVAAGEARLAATPAVSGLFTVKLFYYFRTGKKHGRRPGRHKEAA